MTGRLCSCPVIYLEPNYGGHNEGNGDLLQKVPCTHCYTQCPQPCSRPPLTHASARDSWALMGKSGSVSCGATAPLFWDLVHTRFCCTLQESVSPVLCKFWRLCGRVNGNLLQQYLCHTQPGLLNPEPLPLWQAITDPYLCRRHTDTVQAQSLWDLWVLVCTLFSLCLTRVCFPSPV